MSENNRKPSQMPEEDSAALLLSLLLIMGKSLDRADLLKMARFIASSHGVKYAAAEQIGDASEIASLLADNGVEVSFYTRIVHGIFASREQFMLTAPNEIKAGTAWPCGRSMTNDQVDILLEEAWDRGHANGYYSVWSQAEDLLGLLSRLGPIK